MLQETADDPIDLWIETLLAERVRQPAAPAVRRFVLHRAEKPPVVDQVDVLAHAEIVALDHCNRAPVGPAPDSYTGERAQQARAMLCRRLLADAGAATVLLPVGTACGNRLLDAELLVTELVRVSQDARSERCASRRFVYIPKRSLATAKSSSSPNTSRGL